jgi:hypothetical protein
MDTRDLQRALRRKLDAEEDRSGDHVFYWVTIDGKQFRAAKFSHPGRGQLGDHVITDTTKRLKLTKAQLEELVDCPMTGERFWELWVVDGV